MSFSCNFRGQCEPDPDGIYPTRESCLADCQPEDNVDVARLIYSYTATPEIAPSDAVIVVNEITGVRLPINEASITLANIESGSLIFLLSTPSLWPWMFTQTGVVRAVLLANLFHPVVDVRTGRLSSRNNLSTTLGFYHGGIGWLPTLLHLDHDVRQGVWRTHLANLITSPVEGATDLTLTNGRLTLTLHPPYTYGELTQAMLILNPGDRTLATFDDEDYQTVYVEDN